MEGAMDSFQVDTEGVSSHGVSEEDFEDDADEDVAAAVATDVGMEGVTVHAHFEGVGISCGTPAVVAGVE